MSLSVDGRIKDKKLDMELVKVYINNFFSADLQNQLIYQDEIIVYKCEEYAFDIIFDYERKYPCNIWDSEILCDEYEYSQVIYFNVYKESDYTLAYKCILNFFSFLWNRISCDILVTSDVFNDICYMDDTGIRWSDRWLNSTKNIDGR